MTGILFTIFLTMVLVFGASIYALWYFSLPLYYSAAAPFATLLFFYTILPLIFRCSKSIQRHFVFQAKEKLPPTMDFGSIAAGFFGCRNFYLYPAEGIALGVWHILPRSLLVGQNSIQNSDHAEWIDSLRTSGKHIVIYIHGNTGTRALDHRKEIYKILQREDYHVIAFDYRGYGDSSPVDLSERTVVEDTIRIFRWVRAAVGDTNPAHIFVWGHSLGTGIAISSMKILSDAGEAPPRGLLLESPFTNIADGLRGHKKALLYKWLPGFHRIFITALHRNDIAFKSDQHITKLKIPILILHAVDDETVPFDLGKQLFETGDRNRPCDSKPIQFREFGPGHGHKDIHKAPALPGVIREFIRCSVNDEWYPIGLYQ